MILIITAQQPQLDSPIDERFGRCQWFVRMDTTTKKWEAFPNSGVNFSGGAGIAAAQFVIDQKAEAVISGDFGPNASNTLHAAKIDLRLFTKEISTVQEAIDFFLEEKLPAFQQA